MELPNVSVNWINNAVIIIVLVVCAIWALMLVGAWAAHLKKKNRFSEIVELNRVLADKIMAGMYKELAILLPAIGLVVFSIINSDSLSESVDKASIKLLSQLRSADPAQQGLISSLGVLAELPSSYQDTLKAYQAYYKSENSPDKLVIEKLLPKKKSVFDFRLLGMVSDVLGEPGTNPSDFETKKNFLVEGRKYYEQSLADLEDHPPKNITPELAANLAGLIKKDIIDVDLGLAEFENDKKRKKGLLVKVKNDFQKLRLEWGRSPGLYLDLMAAHTLLEEYDEAIIVLVSVRSEPRLSAEDKQFLKLYVVNLDLMYELRPLAEYVERSKGTKWIDFVNQSLAQRPKGN